ncbi:MAG: hypothetical protein V3R16_11055 [Nitrospirales bacterium]
MMTVSLLIVIPGLLLAEPSSAQEARDYVAERIQVLLARQYDHKMISSGQNFPSVNVQHAHRGDLTILLRDGVPVLSIRDYFGWSAAEMQQRLDELVAAGLVQRTASELYVPTIMLMSLGDVARHMRVPESLLEEAAELVVRHLPEVQRRYAEINGFRHVPFESASLLILSDVLLDNWQINAVERGFLKAERPLRAGNRYYYSIQEKAPLDSTEAFGIYGNQYRQYGPVTVGVYGNQRTNNPLNFLTLGRDQLEQLFETRPDTVRVFKQELLKNVVEAAHGAHSRLSPRYHAGLKALGWERRGQIVVPVLDEEASAALSSMADLVTDDLLALLERYRPAVTQAYEGSPYSREVTFEEYFIWWYHLFYTAVTDRLIAQGYIANPASGITTYLMVSS